MECPPEYAEVVVHVKGTYLSARYDRIKKARPNAPMLKRVCLRSITG